MTQLSSTAQQQAKDAFNKLGYVPLTCSKSLSEEMRDLRKLLQDALVIEHATIPPYLTMLYTAGSGADWKIIEVIRSVVVEEMLHFTLVGNLLNAIGETPAINQKDFIPDYPSYLPHKIDGIKIQLLSFSKQAVKQARIIEHPKSIRPEIVAAQVLADMTIGEYYALIEAKLRALVEHFGEPAVFCGDASRQIPTHVFYYGGGGGVVEVCNLRTALEAIQIIVDQGEGASNGIWTGTNSAELGGYQEVAHYFRFNELYEERLYREGDTVQSGPTGQPLQVDWDNATATVDNAKLDNYPAGEVHDAVAAFNTGYCKLLGQLQNAFDGEPLLLENAVVEMCNLRNDFCAITANPFPGNPKINCAPSFEFVKIPPVHSKTSAPPKTTCLNSNQETLARLDQAYSTGDLTLALSCMSDQVIWDISGPCDVPYLGVFYGHSGFSRFWTLLGDTVNFGQAGITKAFFEGDEAMAYGGEQGTTKLHNSPYHYDWAIQYRFNAQHQLTLMRQYFDPRRIQAALSTGNYPTQTHTQGAEKGHLQHSLSTQKGKCPMSTSSDKIPAIPYPFTMPFYYAALTNVGVFYAVPANNVASYLKDTGLSPALFNGQALVSFNFQLYSGQFASGIDTPPEQWGSSGAAITQELELNIVCYPSKRADQIADITIEEFLTEGDQTKLFGNHRVWVPCDADIAIAAGKTLFGEPKFKTTFKVNLASPNPVRQNTEPYQAQWVQSWGFRVDDPKESSKAIFTCVVNTTGIDPVPGNFSPITEYGNYQGQMIGCRWNILQAMNTYLLQSGSSEAVNLTFGNSNHPMKTDMQELLGKYQPVAVRTFNSSPAAIQSRAYYP